MQRTLLAVLIVFGSSAGAYEPERAKNNVAHEAAECAAYFLLASAAPTLGQSTVQGLRAKYTALAEVSIFFSSVEVTKARVSLASESMRREMKQDWSNFSIVIQKYNYPCLDLANNPEARLKYWLDTKD